MSYNVGSVEVSVLPNAERFNAILGPQLTEHAREIGHDMGDKIADGIRERLALLGDVNLGVDTTKAGLEVDKFLAETKAKSAVAGDEAGKSLGNNLSKSAADSGKGASPLIVGAIAGGLIAGAPVMLGAAGILFAGIAAAAVHSNQQVTAAFAYAGDEITNMLKTAAQVTVPFFVSALNRLGSAAVSLGPQFHAAFAALQQPLDSLTTGLIGLVSNAMPGLVSAVQAAGPVFQGLSLLLSQIGTGLGQFFSIIAQHGPAAGAVFDALGSIVGALLPILGELVGAGSELGSQILPTLATVLHAVAGGLSAIAPILPAVLAGFAAFKIVSLLTGPLGLLSAKLQTVAADASGLSLKLSGGLASGVAGLAGALPALALVTAGLAAAFSAISSQTDEWARALLDGGSAAAAATTQLANLSGSAAGLHSGFTGFIQDITGSGSAMDVMAHSGEKAAQTAKDIYNAMSPLQQKQQDVTKATNDLEFAQQKYGYGSLQAAGFAAKLVGAQDAQKDAQLQLNNATNAALSPEAKHQAALEGIGAAAKSAKTATTLLKDALDALTGKAVTADQAEIAITNAVIAATTATKGQSGALLDANGHLNLYSQKGAAASQALMDLAGAQHQDIAVMEQQHATTDAVTAKTAQMRAQFIQVAGQMGINAAEAQRLADRYFGIPKQVNTRIAADTAPAMNAINGVLTALARVRDKTITITTVTTGFHISGGNSASGTQVAGAIGGIVHPYASGGIEPMKGGIAQVVPPNTLRVIGDRVTDDEAYIPINRDLRSIAIWRQAGERMGQLSAANGGAAPRNDFSADRGPLISVGTMVVPDSQHPQETAAALAFMARTR